MHVGDVLQPLAADSDAFMMALLFDSILPSSLDSIETEALRLTADFLYQRGVLSGAVWVGVLPRAAVHSTEYPNPGWNLNSKMNSDVHVSAGQSSSSLVHTLLQISGACGNLLMAVRRSLASQDLQVRLPMMIQLCRVRNVELYPHNGAAAAVWTCEVPGGISYRTRPHELAFTASQKERAKQFLVSVIVLATKLTTVQDASQLASDDQAVGEIMDWVLGRIQLKESLQCMLKVLADGPDDFGLAMWHNCACAMARILPSTPQYVAQVLGSMTTSVNVDLNEKSHSEVLWLACASFL
jgi:hypothetical protein